LAEGSDKRLSTQYLRPNIQPIYQYVSFLAMPLPAYVVVAVELVLIAGIRHRFFGTSWWLSALQVIGGGALVFVAALIFGNA
jgi:hypothetical protein